VANSGTLTGKVAQPLCPTPFFFCPAWYLRKVRGHSVTLKWAPWSLSAHPHWSFFAETIPRHLEIGHQPQVKDGFSLGPFSPSTRLLTPCPGSCGGPLTPVGSGKHKRDLTLRDASLPSTLFPLRLPLPSQPSSTSSVLAKGVCSLLLKRAVLLGMVWDISEQKALCVFFPPAVFPPWVCTPVSLP